jgi:hypothetical protein
MMITSAMRPLLPLEPARDLNRSENVIAYMLPYNGVAEGHVLFTGAQR